MITIPFYSSCGAAGSLVLVSKRIAFTFRLLEIRARFTQGSNNLLKLRFYLAQDDHAPSSGVPNGFSMLSELGQVDYIVGNDDSKLLIHEVICKDKGYYLKVYAVNSDSYEHDVDVQMIIEPLNKEVT